MLARLLAPVALLGLASCVGGLYGLIATADPAYVLMILVGAIAALGNALLELDRRRRIVRIDAEFYAARKALDLELMRAKLKTDLEAAAAVARDAASTAGGVS